jgi:hypothetical protein
MDIVLDDEAPGVAGCAYRVTHATPSKDTGLVDPVTGAASDPQTPRGWSRRDAPAGGPPAGYAVTPRLG